MNIYFSSEDTEISVSPLWAELQSLKVRWREYLYQKVPWFWQRQSPILFPIVGRLKDDTYEYEGKRYEIPQHGFLREREWRHLDQNDAHSCTFSITADPETRERYPWDFTLEIKYIIEKTTLRVEYSVTNTGSETLPFSLGGHPAFHLEGPLSEYEIQFDSDDGEVEYATLSPEVKWLLSWDTKKLYLKEGKIRLSEELFYNDALIFRDLLSKRYTLLRDGKMLFTFDRGNFPHFALWKQPNAPFLCFEPWQGYADSIDTQGNILEKPWMIMLPSAETMTFFWQGIFPEK